MPPDGEDDWDSFEDRATVSDRPTIADDAQQAIPEATTPRPDVTDRHRTLQGYVDREVEIAQARAEERAYVLMAIKLMMMQVKVHVLAADAEIAKIERWCAVPENDHLVRVALRRA